MGVRLLGGVGVAIVSRVIEAHVYKYLPRNSDIYFKLRISLPVAHCNPQCPLQPKNRGSENAPPIVLNQRQRPRVPEELWRRRYLAAFRDYSPGFSNLIFQIKMRPIER